MKGDATTEGRSDQPSKSPSDACIVSASRSQEVRTDAVQRLALVREPDDLAAIEDHERPLERVLRVALLGDKLAHEAGVARRPADREAPADIALDLLDLFVQVAPGQTLDVASLPRSAPNERRL